MNAAKEVFTKAAIIIDRYHVAKLYRASLDKFRKTILADLKKTLSDSEYEAIKNVTNILRRGSEYLSKEEKKKVAAIFPHSLPLSEAYRLILALTHIFNTPPDRRGSARAICKLDSRCSQNQADMFQQIY